MTPFAAGAMTHLIPRASTFCHVHLDIGQRHALDAVAQRVTRVIEAGRIHDQAVDAVVQGLVDAIDGLALDVRVEDLELVLPGAGVPLEHRVEFARRGGAIELGLTFAEVNHVRALNEQDPPHRKLPGAASKRSMECAFHAGSVPGLRSALVATTDRHHSEVLRVVPKAVGAVGEQLHVPAAQSRANNDVGAFPVPLDTPALVCHSHAFGLRGGLDRSLGVGCPQREWKRSYRRLATARDMHVAAEERQ